MIQIVVTGSSSRLRKQALWDPKITLKYLLVVGRELEMSTFQAAAIEQKQHDQEELRNMQRAPRQRQTPHASQCRNCGKEWPHETNPCPARSEECRKCGKLNHFAKLCRSSKPDPEASRQNRCSAEKIQPVEHIPDNTTGESSSSDESSYCYMVNTRDKANPVVNLKIR